ncbi:MAG: hypothetical protein AAB874_02695, partial [Patescibacteria group bacterium]
MNLFIQLVADYGKGDPAFAEVTQRLKFLAPQSQINPVAVPKFSTIATGLWIAQLATVNAFGGLVIYSNTAPRKKAGEHEDMTYKGKFGHLAYTILENGVYVIAVHYGYAFSFLKKRMKNFRLVNVSNVGTQFRSRDNYPDAVIGLVKGDKKYQGEVIPFGTIPDEPENILGFIDGYGNLKTTNRISKLNYKSGDKIRITLNGVTHVATVADQAYHVADGELVYAPGSTGGEDRFQEIWVRNGSAYEVFDRPHVES